MSPSGFDEWGGGEDGRERYWRALEERVGEAATGDPFVLFRLGSESFLLEASLCKGVVRKGRIAKLPFTPPFLLGVAGIRGEVVSTTDPRLLLGLVPEHDRPQGYLLIVAAAGLKTALWVDRVEDVFAVDAARIRRGEGVLPKAPEGLVLGMWVECEPPVRVLDGRRYLEATAITRD